jgi:hypothetical protein
MGNMVIVSLLGSAHSYPAINAVLLFCPDKRAGPTGFGRIRCVLKLLQTVAVIVIVEKCNRTVGAANLRMASTAATCRSIS